MKNKKAWLRIVEAFIAVMIVATVLVVLVAKSPRPASPGDIKEIQRSILNSISLNNELREEILDGIDTEKEDTNNSVRTLLPGQYDFLIKVCQVEEICGMDFYVPKSVYADEILITATLDAFNPKKLKLLIWRKD